MFRDTIHYFGVLLIAFLSWSHISVASDGIHVFLKGAENQKVYLAMYKADQVLLVDSVTLNSGKGMIPITNVKGAGLYMLYINKDFHQDLLLADDYNMTLYGTLGDKLEIEEVVGADETNYFLQYENKLAEARTEMTALKKAYTGSKDDKSKKEMVSKQIKSLNSSMKKFLEQENKRSTKFYSSFLKATSPVRLPDSLLGDRKDSTIWIKQYMFMKEHYFDHIDFSKSGFVRTPILKRALDSYMNDILIPLPDSIGPALLGVIEKSKKNDDVYAYVANYLLTSSINSKIMGMDKVFVEIASMHQLRSGQTLVDSINYKKIKDKVMAVVPNLLGGKAHNLHLQTPSGEDVALYDLAGRFHVVAFWDPNCSHCKTVIPELYQKVFTKYFGEGVDFWAVNTQQDVEKWKSFIKDKNIGDWTNVYDKYGNSLMHHYYNITTTPKLFLLDNEMKIVAKNIGVETLISILEEKL